MNFRWLMALVAGALGPSAALAQGVPAADLAKAHQTATRFRAAVATKPDIKKPRLKGSKTGGKSLN